jgi:GNAT superfamily N-acetyltransferase
MFEQTADPKNALPLLTSGTMERIETSHLAFWAEKLALLRALPGNPYGAHARRFGKALALLAVGAKENAFFNRVGNISVEELPALDDIMSWYRAQNVPCRFDIIPAHGEDALFRRLAVQGLYHSDFYAMLYGFPQITAAPPAHIQIRAVQPEESELFADLYLAAFDIPDAPGLAYLRESIRLLPGRPGLYCFLAAVNNLLAGMAILFIHQHTGYLATAAVLPAFRGYGCHKALLQARLTVARRKDCQLVAGSARIGSISQQNMEKVGLRMAYTKALWTEY